MTNGIKVGDKVKLLTNRSGESYDCVGNTGTVKRTDGQAAEVDYGGGSLWWSQFHSLQLVEEENSMTNDIKVGDRIRATHSRFGITAGKEYVVAEMSGEEPQVLDDAGDPWIMVGQYEKVTAPTTELKVGDWIEVTKAADSHFTVGERYKVTGLDWKARPMVVDNDGDSTYLLYSKYKKVEEGTAMSNEWKASELKAGDRFKYVYRGESCEAICTGWKGHVIESIVTEGKNPVNSLGEGHPLRIAAGDTVTKLDKYGNVIPKVAEKKITFEGAVELLRDGEDVIARAYGKERTVRRFMDLEKLSPVAKNMADLVNLVDWYQKVEA